MLPGFNHNLRYQDRVFHVQTEDAGVAKSRLVTQVFIDGHLISIVNGDYSHIVAAGGSKEQIRDQVRIMMQDQHKGEMKRLVAGAFDEKIRIYLGGPEVEEDPLLPAPAADFEMANTTRPIMPGEGPPGDTLVPPPLPDDDLAPPPVGRPPSQPAHQTMPDTAPKPPKTQPDPVVARAPETQPDPHDRLVPSKTQPDPVKPAPTSVLQPGLGDGRGVPVAGGSIHQMPPGARPPASSGSIPVPPPRQPPSPSPRPSQAPPQPKPGALPLGRNPSVARRPPPSGNLDRSAESDAFAAPSDALSSAPPPRQAKLRQPSAVPLRGDSTSFLAELDREMQRQTPIAPPRRNSRPPSGVSKIPSPTDRRRSIEPKTPSQRPAFARRASAPQDTLIDGAIPASLREAIEERRRKASSKPAAQVQPAQPKAPAPESVTRQAPPNDQTVLEMDAQELRKAVEAQRAKLRKARDDQRVVVTERSLDEALSSYLADED